MYRNRALRFEDEDEEVEQRMWNRPSSSSSSSSSSHTRSRYSALGDEDDGAPATAESEFSGEDPSLGGGSNKRVKRRENSVIRMDRTYIIENTDLNSDRKYGLDAPSVDGETAAQTTRRVIEASRNSSSRRVEAAGGGGVGPIHQHNQPVPTAVPSAGDWTRPENSPEVGWQTLFGEKRGPQTMRPYEDFGTADMIESDAWVNRASKYWRQIVIHEVLDADLWYLTELAPIAFHDGSKIVLETVTFEPTLLDRAPYETPPRTTTYTQNTSTIGSTRYNKGIVSEWGAINTPEGQWRWAMLVRVIIAAIHETASLAVVLAILSAAKHPDHLAELSGEGMTGPQFHAAADRAVNMCGMVQKNMDGWHMTAQSALLQLRDRGVPVESTKLIFMMPFGIGAFVAAQPEHRLYFMSGKPREGPDDPAAMNSYQSHPIRIGKKFLMGSKRATYDPLIQTIVFGEHMVASGNPYTAFMPQYRTDNCKLDDVFDSLTDGLVSLSYADAIRSCHIWSKDRNKTRHDGGGRDPEPKRTTLVHKVMESMVTKTTDIERRTVWDFYMDTKRKAPSRMLSAIMRRLFVHIGLLIATYTADRDSAKSEAHATYAEKVRVAAAELEVAGYKKSATELFHKTPIDQDVSGEMRMQNLLKTIEILDYVFIDFCLRNDVPLFFDVLLNRKDISYKVAVIVAVVPGINTVCLFLGQADTLVGMSTKAKNVSLHLTLNMVAHVMENKNVVVLPYSFLKEHEQGGGVKFWTEADWKKVEKNRGDEDIDMKDIYACLLAPGEDEEYKLSNQTRIDATGHFNPLFYNDSSDALHYSTARFYSEYWDWKDLQHKGAQGDVLERCVITTLYGGNTMTHRARYRTMKRTTGDREEWRLLPGKGHRGNFVQPNFDNKIKSGYTRLWEVAPDGSYRAPEYGIRAS